MDVHLLRDVLQCADILWWTVRIALELAIIESCGLWTSFRQALKEQRLKELRSRLQALALRWLTWHILAWLGISWHDLAKLERCSFAARQLQDSKTSCKLQTELEYLQAHDSVQFFIFIWVLMNFSYSSSLSLLSQHPSMIQHDSVQEIQDMHVSPPLMGWLYPRRTPEGVRWNTWMSDVSCSGGAYHFHWEQIHANKRRLRLTYRLLLNVLVRQWQYKNRIEWICK